MEANLELINSYLIAVFNDILTIEESELKKVSLKIFQSKKCIP